MDVFFCKKKVWSFISPFLLYNFFCVLVDKMISSDPNLFSQWAQAENTVLSRKTQKYELNLNKN